MYLPFSDWYVSQRTCPFVFQINRKMVNTIWFRVALKRFRKDFSVCTIKAMARVFRTLRMIGKHSEIITSFGIIGGPNEVPPWNFSDHYSTIILKGLRGPLIKPPWWLQKRHISRTAVRLIAVVSALSSNSAPDIDTSNCITIIEEIARAVCSTFRFFFTIIFIFQFRDEAK